jgi:hypothetical protein
MKLYSFETAVTATIDGIIDLDGARDQITVSIEREPSTSAIENLRRLSTEVLLSIAAAYPLEQGERIEVSGLGPRSRSSEKATISYAGKGARKIAVERDFPVRGKSRLLHLVCDVEVPSDDFPDQWVPDGCQAFRIDECWTLGCPFDQVTDERMVRQLCLELRKRKSLAAAGMTIDEGGSIIIPEGMETDRGHYVREVGLDYRPRLSVWEDDLHRRYDLCGLMKEHPEAGEMARWFIDELPARQKARVLASVLAV